MAKKTTAKDFKVTDAKVVSAAKVGDKCSDIKELATIVGILLADKLETHPVLKAKLDNIKK